MELSRPDLMRPKTRPPARTGSRILLALPAVVLAAATADG